MVADEDRLIVRHVSDVIGEWGPWQRNLFFLILINGIWDAMNNMGYAFNAPSVQYWCADRRPRQTVSNITNEERCFEDTKKHVPCHKWLYENDIHVNIISEFDLVCNQAWMASLSQSFFMFGFMISGLLFGHLADKVGRQKVIFYTFIIQILAGVWTALAENIYHYIIGRFILGVGVSACSVTFFTFLMECLGSRNRADLAILVGMGWSFGYLIIPALAYYFSNFRYFQLFTSATQLPAVVVLYFLYESPRWLIVNKHYDLAEKTISKITKQNGRNSTNIKEKVDELKQNIENEMSKSNVKQSKSAIDLIRTPKMCRNSLVMWFSFMVTAFVYYGVSYNIGSFGGNLFFNFMLSGLAEVPSIPFVLLSLKFSGRKKFFVFLTFLNTLCNLGLVFVTLEGVLSPRIVLLMIVKFCANSCFIMVYIYAAELFPTVVRSIGIGSSSVAARIGSITAPFIKEFCQTSSVALVFLSFAILSLINGLLVLLLPETKDAEIPDTIEQVENLNPNTKKLLNATSNWE